jgi:subtilisin family serine protease
MTVTHGQRNFRHGAAFALQALTRAGVSRMALSLLLFTALACALPIVNASAAGNGNGNGNNNGIGSGNSGGTGSTASFAAGHILVAPQENATRADFAAALGANNGRSLGKIGNLDVDVVEVPLGQEASIAARLARHPKVKFAELDQRMEPSLLVNDPNFTGAWHLQTMGAPSAWDYTMGSGVTIAILDSGVDATHPDLAPQLVPGYNFYDNTSNTSDVSGHGTAIAGIAAAASNNGIGVASVAGSGRIMPLRITDTSGYGYWSAAAQSLSWAADHGARVANISYQGASASGTIQTAANYFRSKGGVVFVAAGNTGTQDNTAPTSLITVVSATDSSDQRASWSTYGSFVDLSAPGVGIWTTTVGGGYSAVSGTSASSPVAAGVAALVIARRPDFTASQVDATLASTAVDLGAPGSDIYYGAGRVNAAAAVQAAAGSPPTPDTSPPNVAIASPTGGTVSGVVSVSVTATDNVGVTRVDLRVNGTTVTSITNAPYLFSWNSATVADGSATLAAVAYDAAGNSKTSTPVTITVSNAPPPTSDTTPPTVSIASPTGGTVSGTVAVSVNASDNVGVTRVDLRVNGATVATRNAAPYQFNWNSATAPDGTASLTATAYDAAGNSATSATVSVNIQNAPTGVSDTTPPVLTITNPANGATVSGNVSVKSTASDNSGSAGISQKLFIDGVQRASAQGSSLSYNWNTRKLSGPHTVVVTASDAAGNSTSATVTVQVIRAK